MSEQQKKIDDIVQLCLDLQREENALEEKRIEVKEIRDNIIDKMKHGFDNPVTFVDLPEMLRVTLVEYVKESVSSENIPEVKQMLNPAQQAAVIKTKEVIDKDGIAFLKTTLSEEELGNILSLSPVCFIQFRDREK
jgi:hypothetical protein